jgi:WhiB family transcriptional regulator, redox-sensing transcriptional regulator
VVTPRTEATTTTSDNVGGFLDYRRPTWQAEAACRSMPVTMFVADKLTPTAEAEALAVCNGCTVVAACKAWSLDIADQVGIAGGMTEAERKAIRKAAKRAPTTIGGGSADEGAVDGAAS